MNKLKRQEYISNIENGRMNPTLNGEHVESISTLETCLPARQEIANALGISSTCPPLEGRAFEINLWQK